MGYVDPFLPPDATMIKPTRGLQAPSFKETKISHLHLIKFMEECQHQLTLKGEPDSAFRFEMVAEYLRQDFKPGTPLQYTPMALGL